MLIFHHFSTAGDALEFIKAVQQNHPLRAHVFSSQKDSDRIDPFPVELTPPIVLIERTNPSAEKHISNQVSAFGGIFAGT